MDEPNSGLIRDISQIINVITCINQKKVLFRVQINNTKLHTHPNNPNETDLYETQKI